MDRKRVLFISQEISPYLKETKLSNLCRQLPQGIMEKGKDIRIFMPKFGCINERRNQLHEVIRLCKDFRFKQRFNKRESYRL